MKKKKPWMKWYPSDWRGDPRLRMCSLAARGLWLEICGYMHEAEPYGFLLISGSQPTVEQIASLVGRPLKEVQSAYLELGRFGVFSRDGRGVIFSRRMVRDDEKAKRDQENGKGGGNPTLLKGVNPQDKAQIPEARVQKEEGGSGASLPVAAAGEQSITAQAFALAAQYRTAVGADQDDPQWMGLAYTAQVWIARNYDHNDLLAIGAGIASRYGPKPMKYHATVVEREIEARRANPQPVAAAVSRPHAQTTNSQARPGSFQAARDRGREAHLRLKNSIAADEAGEAGGGPVVELLPPA